MCVYVDEEINVLFLIYTFMTYKVYMYINI